MLSGEEKSLVRSAAIIIAGLVKQGRSYSDAEMEAASFLDVPDELIPRVQELYFTEYAVDDG